MRKILKIAKLELSILFYSPVAWLVLAIFMIQCGLSFLGGMQAIRTTLSLGYQTKPITDDLFGGDSGLFAVVQGNLYLYLPILTMGLMSRETSSGSIKLLLSSPVKLRQIILGKYFAIIGYGLTLIGILLIYCFIGVFFIKDADMGLLVSGLLGLYLLICTYAAIGLFMSCLTTYQVVAAISTLAIFTCLRYMGNIGQDIDFVRDLTYFLSISGRTEKMVAGLITTKDVFYYLIIITSFLSLCVLRLKAERELKPWTVKTGRYILLVSTALCLGYFTSRPLLTGYLDATAAKSLTITKSSQQIAKQIDGPLTVTTYANLLAPNLWHVMPESRNRDLSKLEQYKRFIPGMEMKYVYYYQKPIDTNYADYRYNPNLKGITNIDKIAKKMATNMGVESDLFMPPAEINKLINLEPEGNLLVRKLDYKGKSTFLRFYTENNPYASEAEVMAALKRLLVKAPKVVFITGNNERGTINKGDREYQMISALKTRKSALINQGFDVDTADLNKQEIPADAGIIVLGDPTVPFNAQAQQKLAAYVNKGGNMLITGEPGRQNVLNPVLLPLGVQLKAGQLIKPDRDLTPGFIDAQLSDKALGIDSNIDQLQKGHATVAMQGAAAIDYAASGSFRVEPLLLSPQDGWNKQGLVDLNGADNSFNAAQGDQKGVFPIAVSITRNINGKQQRIVVSGDADFISNSEFTRAKRGYNDYYLDGLFRWFSNGAFPIDVKRPPTKDMDLKISREQITGLMWLCKGVIPAIIAILGAITLIRRRRS